MSNQDTTLDLSIHDKPAMVAAVLFADIAGSTKLYDILGDTRAKQLIDETLSELRAATARFQGRVVKTIGDEIMCVFRDPERGMLAACDMQTRVNALPIVDGVKRLVRVGFHFGAVIEEKGDVFGDTVNVAARMAGVAKGLQIMTSRATADQLPAGMRASVRPIATVAVKGKEDMPVCEVIWQSDDDLTMTVDSLHSSQPAKNAELALTHNGHEVVLSGSLPAATFGRGVDNTFVIGDLKASRNHARVEKRRDRYYLIDQSTNGTFVTVAGEAEMELHREEVMLRGTGMILFGHSATESAEETVQFVVRA
ncbi:MAG TPA: adenylate/guanylate cyclase domain-containing protein [Burkholderiales bacterium]|jgi:class 3 adenylate cyclase|nr:adenylate/guanylate cyclase domain-containing protein [Burkholderiales bacterium]